MTFHATDRKGTLTLQDDPTNSSFLSPPSFISGGGGLCSTATDYLTFCRALLNGGELGGVRLIGPKTLALMTTNHLPGGRDLPEMSRSMFAEATYNGIGFGLGFSVTMDPAKTLIPGSPGEYAWGGAATTSFWIDPAEELIAIFMTQVLPSSAYPIRRELRSMIYAAITESNLQTTTPRSFQHLRHDQTRQEQRHAWPDDDCRQHEQHRNQHDHRVLERITQPHPCDRAGDHQAQAVGRRHQSEGERDDRDDRKLHRMKVNRFRQRLENGTDDDDRRNRIEEAAHYQKAERNEESGPDRTHAPGRDVGQQFLWDPVISQQPTERTCGAHAEQRDPGQTPGVEQSLVEFACAGFTIKERR